MSFFRSIFGGDNPGGAAVGAGTSAPIQRRSTGFHEFIRAIGRPEGQVVLDLGPTSPANLHFITGLGTAPTTKICCWPPATPSC